MVDLIVSVYIDIIQKVEREMHVEKLKTLSSSRPVGIPTTYRLTLMVCEFISTYTAHCFSPVQEQAQTFYAFSFYVCGLLYVGCNGNYCWRGQPRTSRFFLLYIRKVYAG